MKSRRLERNFFMNESVEVAKELIGKILVRVWDDNSVSRYLITKTEAYSGEEDLACHASKGRTARTEVMYDEGGKIYVYLIYGMHWMLNFVTGEKDNPQAVLICGVENISGSGRVGKALKIDKSFYGEDLINSDRIWIEDNNQQFSYNSVRRVGIDYAGDIWKNKLWRFEILL